MKILVSNDDGVHAPGLTVLVECLQEIGEVFVVAPDRNRSGASNSLTLDVPIHASKISKDCYSVAGTPTDCVHLAITGLLEERPDIVVAGVNEGANLGDDVLYSGTVAAAMEGRMLGLPAIAVSLVHPRADSMHFETGAIIARNLISRLIENPVKYATVLNVNVPNCPADELSGIVLSRLGSRHRAEPTVKEIDPRGKEVYWVGLPGPHQDAGPGTDFYAISENKASITPLQVDMTHHEALDQFSNWLNSFDKIVG